MKSSLDTRAPHSTAPTHRWYRRRWVLAAGTVAILGLAFVLYWFQPQKLFIQQRVADALPTNVAPAVASSTPATPTPTASATTTPASTSSASAPPAATPTPTVTPTPTPTGTPTSAPVAAIPAGDVATGSFVSRDHATTGKIRIIALADGSRVLRLEGLDTSNGPDLFLYLSPNAANGPESAFGAGYLDLGKLKGNKGDQNYTLPAGVDLRAYQSVAIWCHRFSAVFGAADLQVA